jgi:hypothetical protein
LARQLVDLRSSEATLTGYLSYNIIRPHTARLLDEQPEICFYVAELNFDVDNKLLSKAF